MPLCQVLLSCSKKRDHAKTFIGLAVYDSTGQRLATVTDETTKAARKDWENLAVNVKIQQDGFVQVIGSEDDSRRVLHEGDVQGNWITVGKSDSGEVAFDDQSATNAYGCTAWYWCTSSGCTYIETTCQELPDYGDTPGDGSGGGGLTPEAPSRPGCATCQRLARAEKTARMASAKYTLASNLAAWCPAGAASAGYTAATIFAWLNIIPEAGTVADIVIGLIAAGFEYADCATSHILSYSETAASANNNLYKDLRDCAEKYTDCP